MSRINLEVSENSPFILLDDLLSAKNDWRNVQDVVQLTIKALGDVVKSQGDTIRELEKKMPSRASKQELQQLFAQKANCSDVSRTIQDISSSLDQKVSIDDLQNILKDYPFKIDLLNITNQKVGFQDIQQILQEKLNVQDYDNDFEQIQQQMEQMQNVVLQQMNNLVQKSEFENFREEVKGDEGEKKIKLEYMDKITGKADKQQIDNLQRDIKKIQGNMLLQSQFEDFIAQAESQARIVQDIQNKLDRGPQQQEFHKFKNDIKLEIKDLINKENETFFKSYLEDNNKAQIKSRVKKVKNQFDQQLKEMKDSLSSSITGLEEQINKQNRDQQRFIQNTDQQINSLKLQIQQEEQDIDNEFQIQTIQQIKILHHQMKQLQENNNNDEEQNSFSRIQNVKQMEINRLFQEVDQVKLKQNEFTKYIQENKSNDNNVKQAKNKLDDFEKQMTCYKRDLNERVQALANGVRNQEKELQNFLDLNQIQEKQFSEKIDIFLKLCDQKVGFQDFEDLSQQVQNFVQQLDQKVCYNQFKDQHSLTSEKLSQIDQLIQYKINIKDVCSILDQKANIADINTSLKDIYNELDQKAAKKEIAKFLNNQTQINQSLCAENFVGRWQWKSGELKSNSLIPWENQIVNNLPENFIWNENKCQISIQIGGVYEINFAFYSTKKPSVGFLLNGENIFQAVNNASNITVHGKIRETKPQSGNIIGVSYLDIISLPSNSKLSFSFDGDRKGHGILQIRKI